MDKGRTYFYAEERTLVLKISDIDCLSKIGDTTGLLPTGNE